ncbi:MAG: LPS export ABC transporter ATP-binding protein [Gammaproteobacteria bacterium]|jgi:lipopolysaccharide export system ATP-binding protein
MSNLRAEHLEKSYKRKVVDNVTIEVNSGEIVGLLGPNGAGKTTAFYMIVGLINSDKGKILFDQQDITELPMHERARLGVGYLPQEPSVFRKLTVKENILAILELQKELNLKQRLEKLELLLNEFHIGPLRDNVALSLSGGERRRVEIARALANEPKFILLDEPFAGIDPISVVDIKEIIQHLQNRNIGILITDHNVRETLDVCNRAYIVHNGKIIHSGIPTEILNNKIVRDIYLGDDFEL